MRRELQEPLERPIAVFRGPQRFTLSADDAGVKADVGGMVDEALEESRDGSIFSRVARDMTGGEEDAQVSAAGDLLDGRRATSWSSGSEKKLNRPARDAEVDFPSLEKVKEQKGRRVRAAVLEQRIAQALTVPGVERTREGAGADPEAEGHAGAARRPSTRSCWSPTATTSSSGIYKDLNLQKEYTVAVGAVGFDTPAGLYHIQNKAVDPAWHVPNSDWAGDLAGHDRPGRHGREPAEGALARDLRRRRHPRDRPDLLARQRRPRTAASGWRSRT